MRGAGQINYTRPLQTVISHIVEITRIHYYRLFFLSFYSYRYYNFDIYSYYFSTDRFYRKKM